MELFSGAIHLLEEVVELFSGAVGPLESLLGVAKIAHDVTVLPTTSLRSGTLQVGRGSRTVVDRPQTVNKARNFEIFLLLFFYIERSSTIIIL